MGGKLTWDFQNDRSNLVNFHRLKKSDFILEGKMVELNQNENLKQLDRPHAMRKLYCTLNKWILHVVKLFTHVLQNRYS